MTIEKKSEDGTQTGFFATLIPEDVKYPQAHPLYWKDRGRAFALIAEARRLRQVAEEAPMYIAGPYDEENEEFEPMDNLGPHNEAAEFLKQCLTNPTVVRIFAAQECTEENDYGFMHYKEDQERAHTLIAEARRLERVANEAPLYMAGEYDEDSGHYLAEVDFGPLDTAYDFLKECLKNPTVVRVFAAQGCTEENSYGFWR